ncbi:MAG: trypsin-like peptidase domain-containing protein [Pseudomonadota bacterium]
MQQLTRFIVIPALIGAVVGFGIIALNPVEADDRPGFGAAVAHAAPAVVNIYTTKVTRREQMCRDPRFRRLCEAFPDQGQVQNALGSGVIMREDGLVLTNHHVVAQADEILVMFANNQATTARVIGSDIHTDLAVLQIEGRGLPVIPQLNGDQPRVGDIALAIGNPFGLGHSVSQGIISAFARTVITDSPYDDFIQTDAAISPGNSGGALIDYQGRLLGINTMIYTQSGGSDGIGFAIPADIALYVMEQIINHGRVIRGWLGISLTPQPLPQGPQGLYVTQVSHNGPAQRAGIAPGDTVLSINGVPASNAYRITQLIAKTPPGDPIEVEVMRDNQRFLASAIATELPAR